MNFNTRISHAAHHIWSRKGIVSTLLLPFSWLTAAFVDYKQRNYQRHPDRVFRSRLPVVVVGNIYVGGTGKTPVVIALVNALQQRGWQPGVISRGYGVAASNRALTGCGLLDAQVFGDEPALIASSTQAPVSVHPRRALAVQALQRDFPHVDVIIADDGLQHLALGRDVEIVVQDSRGTGNGRLLPAGPLREPASRLADVDYIVNNLQADQMNRAGADTSPPQLAMRLHPVKAVHLVSGRTMTWLEWLSEHSELSIDAVAAIGQPERYFDMLRSMGLRLNQTVALPDHDPYQTSPFTPLTSALILITAKDEVKCIKFADPRLWAIHVRPVFSDSSWFDDLHQRLRAIAQEKQVPIAPTIR